MTSALEDRAAPVSPRLAAILDGRLPPDPAELGRLEAMLAEPEPAGG